MVKIKICGLKRLEDIDIVNKYKPDYIGFVFADSKRKVSHELASELKSNLDSEIISVGVFVDASQEEILDLYFNVNYGNGLFFFLRFLKARTYRR